MPKLRAVRLENWQQRTINLRAEFGVAVGAMADLVVLEARDAREAFATRFPRRWVYRYFDLPAAPTHKD